MSAAHDLGTALRRTVAGSDDDRRALVELATPHVRAWARRLVPDEAVDDVVQESLVELLATASQLRAPEAALTWTRLVVRKQAERARRRSRRWEPLDGLVVADRSEGPAGDLERGQVAEALRVALAAAPPGDRLLVVLRHLGDWSDADLADLLGISPGAVRKRLHDARRRLRPALTPHRPPTTTTGALMTFDPATLLGTAVDAAALEEVPAAHLDRPAATQLATGIAAIDAVAPWTRGGTVDLVGPVGCGQLVLLCEIAHNLCAAGASTIVAVAGDPVSSAPSARLPRLLEPETMAEATIVVGTDVAGASAAFSAAAALAAHLADLGHEVLLAVDATVGAAIGHDTLARRCGTAARGSVTGLRVAPSDREVPAVEAWPASAVLTFDVSRLVAGDVPAVDLLSSRSALVEDQQLPTEALAVAAQVTAGLRSAAALRHALRQDLWMAEGYTGRPGVRSSPQEARARLVAALGAG